MQKQYKILIAEDDEDIVKLLRLYLNNAGFEVVSALDGKKALELAINEDIDLALLDVMMPYMNGFEVIEELRKEKKIPVLILSALDQDDHKINGLSLGADDYITKPFNPEVVVAHVKSLLRRYFDYSNESLNEQNFTIGDLTVDRNTMEVSKNGETIILTPTEFKILTYLCKKPGHIVTKRQLGEYLSGCFIEADENAVRVHISNLRDKIEEDKAHPKILITVRGLGYKVQDGIVK